GNVDAGADVAVQLGHERLAKTHHFGIGLAVRIEIGAALGAADGQPGQGVLEDLLEAQELDDAGVDRGVEAQSALVGPQRGVELDAVSLVDAYPALVIGPAHAEQDLPLRLDDAFDDAVFAIARLGIEQRLQAVEYFAGGLVELVLRRTAVLQTSKGLLDEQGHVRLPLLSGTCRRRACLLSGLPTTLCGTRRRAKFR